MTLDMKPFFIGLATGSATMLLFCVVLLLTAAWTLNWHANRADDGPAPDFCPTVGDTNVTQFLKPIRQKYNIPAMAAALVTSDGIQYVGAVGVLVEAAALAQGLVCYFSRLYCGVYAEGDAPAPYRIADAPCGG